MLQEQGSFGRHFRIYGTSENPIFMANDVAEWIDHSNVTEMLKSIDEDEKLTSTILRAGQNRQMNMLTEDGLYEVLMQSRKPITKQSSTTQTILTTQIWEAKIPPPSDQHHLSS